METTPQAGGNEGAQVVHLRNAEFDTGKAKEFVDRIENLHGDLETLKSEHMTRCKGVREDINIVYGEAKDAGIPKKELKAVVAARKFERKAKAAIEDLEPEQQDTCQMIREALGDFAETPLGKAAVGSDADDLDDLTGETPTLN